MHVVVVGAGIAGLASALGLARTGHRVTVVERDDTPMPATADEAFDWDRRGAPQVRHSHALLARLRNILLERYPDVHRALLDAGASEMRFGENLPPTMVGFEPQPGDEELVMIAARRTTFEWVLRRTVLAEDGVTIRTGHGVVGLTGAAGRATGVRLDDGTEVDADLVVVASGRRVAVDEWLDGIGGRPVAEEVDDTGIVYFSRFYRLNDGCEPPPRSGLIGADLGYLKYGVFIGDNRTFSVTLAIPTDDRELRRRLARPEAFDAAARQFPPAADWLDGRSHAITDGVHAMAGLLNRWRDYVVDGEPVAERLVPVGDAVLCTNPLYGRGCSTAFWSAQLLVDALAAAGDDVDRATRDYDAALRAELLPWYQAGLAQDLEAKRVAAAILAGEDPDDDSSDPRTFMRAVLRDGLAPAMRIDPVVLRAVVRSLHLLSDPDAVSNDPDVGERVLTIYQEREHRPPEPPMGPKTRDDLLRTVAA